jgi:hypothetical protein
MSTSHKALARRAPSEVEGLPTGMIFLPLAKRCGLVLTTSEYARGLRRGKVWKRTQVLRQRTENRR